jgi:hypothetical protein
MKIITGGRQKGKTTNLLMRCAAENITMVVESESHVKVIVQRADELNLKIQKPCTHREFIFGQKNGMKFDKVVIDDIYRFLQTAYPDVIIDSVSCLIEAAPLNVIDTNE